MESRREILKQLWDEAIKREAKERETRCDWNGNIFEPEDEICIESSEEVIFKRTPEYVAYKTRKEMNISNYNESKNCPGLVKSVNFRGNYCISKDAGEVSHIFEDWIEDDGWRQEKDKTKFYRPSQRKFNFWRKNCVKKIT